MSSRDTSRRPNSDFGHRKRDWRFNWKLLAALVVVPLLMVGLGFLSYRVFLGRNLTELWKLAQIGRAHV